MSDDALLDLARMAGLARDWTDAAGRPQRVAPEALRAILEAMGLPAGSAGEIRDSRERLAETVAVSFATGWAGRPVTIPLKGVTAGTGALHLESGGTRDVSLAATERGVEIAGLHEPGYHRLEIGDHEITLAIAPGPSVVIEDVAPGRRIWGLAAQIYSLQGDPDPGFGDFGALGRFAEDAARLGADAVAMSPSHALFAADPSRYSPYSPSTRLFLNVAYADPAAVFGDHRARAAADAAGVGGTIDPTALIDWPEAGARKLAWLRTLFDAFGGEDPACEVFARFRREGGDLLEEHARFEALHAHFLRESGAGDWREWDAAYQDPGSEAVLAFARENAREVEYHAFLQWLAAASLDRAQERAVRAGMAVGLIADLAVGMDPGGSHAWSRKGDVLGGLKVGAPPDLLGPLGQDWGLTTFSPLALQRTGFAPFLATLRAAMRHAGGVRIDHAMGLARLWVIPAGGGAKDGAYLAYPVQDMLRLVALESRRNDAIVIGEDLGTVPEGFRERLEEAGVMGMRVLWFERAHDNGFTRPQDYSVDAAAMTTTHDLPTVAGWWEGRDIGWRAKLGIFEPELEPQERKTRMEERPRLWAACVEAGCAEGRPPEEAEPDLVIEAALRYVAKTPSRLLIVPAEDALGLPEQPNLPGTIDEHPNWRRRLPPDPLQDPAARARLEAVDEERRAGAQAAAPDARASR